VDVLAAPSVTTANGLQAQVAAVEMKSVPGSEEPIAIGPTVDLIPRFSQDGNSVEVTVRAKLNVLNQAQK